jgi:hypothetical protein
LKSTACKAGCQTLKDFFGENKPYKKIFILSAYFSYARRILQLQGTDKHFLNGSNALRLSEKEFTKVYPFLEDIAPPRWRHQKRKGLFFSQTTR